MEFVRMGMEQGIPVTVALCFSGNDAQLRHREESAQRLQRNLDTIGTLASEYSSVCYIDMDTGELDTYTMNENSEEEFRQIFRAGKKYSTALRTYVDSFVAAEDRNRMLKAGSVYNILEELSDRKTFVTRYRDLDGRSWEMKFVKVGDTDSPRAVALVFSNKNDVLQTEIEQERRRRIFNALVEDFACVNYIDIQPGISEDTVSYRTSDLLRKQIPGWERELRFRKRMVLLSWFLVVEEEREKFLEDTGKERMLKELETLPACYVRFHGTVGGEVHEYEFKFSPDKDENSETRGIVAGFHRIQQKR